MGHGNSTIQKYAWQAVAMGFCWINSHSMHQFSLPNQDPVHGFSAVVIILKDATH